MTVDFGSADDQTTEATEQTEPERLLRFPHAGAWVEGWLLPHYRRNPATRRWDPQWWRYEEVGTVLEALWESWEQVRWADAMTAAAWFRDYLWPIMDRITDPDGPFWDYDPPPSTAVPPQWEAAPAPPRGGFKTRLLESLWDSTREALFETPLNANSGSAWDVLTGVPHLRG